MNTSEFARNELAVLKEIAGAIASTANINTVANIILDLSVNYTNAEKGSLMLVSESDELYILASRGINVAFSRAYKARVGEGIVGTVAKNREAVLVGDIRTDSRFKGSGRDRYKTRSFISCPILSARGLLGVININDRKDGTPFDESEFSLMKIIADQAAIAIDNAFLMERLKLKAVELEELNKKLIEADVIRMENLTYLSHELRTPLNSIKGSVYHLNHAETASLPEYQEFFGIVSEETDKMVSIVNNLLSFLRVEDETKVMKKTLINLRSLLEEIVASKLVKTVLSRKNLKVAVDAPDRLLEITGDRVRVAQLFMNLIEGLSHYLEKGDTIGICVAEREHVEVLFSIPERIAPSSLPFLFHAGYMFQTDPEERVKLYLAKKVAEGHRWQLAASAAGEGCIVSLIIPKSAKEVTDAIVAMTADIFTEFISDLLGLNICSVMLRDDLTGDLTIESARGIDEDVIKRTRIRAGDSIAGWVAVEGKPLLVEDIEKDARFGKKNVAHYSTRSLLSLPLRAGEEVIGVINLNNKASGEAFTQRDLEIATALCERVSRYLEKVQKGEYSEKEFRRLVSSFHDLLEVEKKYGKKTPMLPELTARVMDELGAAEEEKSLSVYVSTIYDLGLMLVDEHILNKKGKLTSSETRTLRVHPQTTVDLLTQFEFSEDVLNSILHHHERYDGSGFPDGLKGDQIPFLSRVLAVVDAFSAMLEERPYRKARSREEALEELTRQAGSLYDPKVVDALGKVVRSV